MLSVKVFVALLGEDDPRKNTAVKMVRMGYAIPYSAARRRGGPVVLNPFAGAYLGKWLRDEVAKRGILVVDASWRKLSPVKFRKFGGLHVRLPPLLPGNPINYGKPCILSSVEAAAASLYITGFLEDYYKLLGTFKWMSTFHSLNAELLEAYYNSNNEGELLEAIRGHWGSEDPCYVMEPEAGP